MRIRRYVIFRQLQNCSGGSSSLIIIEEEKGLCLRKLTYGARFPIQILYFFCNGTVILWAEFIKIANTPLRTNILSGIILTLAYKDLEVVKFFKTISV